MTQNQDKTLNPTAAIDAAPDQGQWMHELLRRLFPICRSLTGPGNRETLAILKEHIDGLNVVEVPTGTEVFSWTVPNEWIPKSAEITGPDGQVHARFADNNLHLVNGAQSIDVELDRDELLERIYSLPQSPDLIPYVTSYYHPHWGFCMRDDEKQALPPGKYRARIDVESRPGHLVYGEAVLPGASEQEILIDTYICHPSMANDNLSSVVVATALYGLLAQLPKRRYTYRFVFVPETIGSLCWLMNNEDGAVKRIHAGLVLSCVGDGGPFTFKKSRSGSTEIDRIAACVLGDKGAAVDFFPNSGSDERQFCSPGFDLPVGMLSRTYPGKWPYYHTSGDTAERVTPDNLGGSLEMAMRIVAALEANAQIYRRTDPRGEPMLSKYDLYHRQNLRRNTDMDAERQSRGALMWLLNLADGRHSLLEMAEKSGSDILMLSDWAERLTEIGLLQEGAA
tara:strand:+ start:1002 stop:2357 length:1356 start_codon:yes stop_codon:yes gene_type:complete